MVLVPIEPVDPRIATRVIGLWGRSRSMCESVVCTAGARPWAGTRPVRRLMKRKPRSWEYRQTSDDKTPATAEQALSENVKVKAASRRFPAVLWKRRDAGF